MQKYIDIEYGKDLKNKLDIYVPDNKPKGTIICFHGGGIVSGDKYDDSYLEMAKSFVEANYCYVSVNYRLYPDTKFPDFIDDCANSIKYIKDNLEKYNLSKKIIVSGHSAGAYISLMLCLNKSFFRKYKLKNKDIYAWIIDSAQTTSHFNVINFEKHLNPLSQRIDKYAPLFYVSEKTKFNNMLLIYYENDMPNRYEQNKLLKSAILSFNNTANIQDLVLPGNHCEGSSKKNKDNKYPYVIEVLKYLNSINQDKK